MSTASYEHGRRAAHERHQARDHQTLECECCAIHSGLQQACAMRPGLPLQPCGLLRALPKSRINCRPTAGCEIRNAIRSAPTRCFPPPYSPNTRYREQASAPIRKANLSAAGYGLLRASSGFPSQRSSPGTSSRCSRAASGRLSAAPLVRATVGISPHSSATDIETGHAASCAIDGQESLFASRSDRRQVQGLHL